MKNILVLVVLFCVSLIEAQEKPSGIDSYVYQREIKLRWSYKPDVTWQISVDGKDPVSINTNTYVIAGLEPATQYDIKVRAVKNGKYSDYITVAPYDSKTSGIYVGVNDLDRVPHLRSIQGARNLYGQIYKKYIDLYYNDLYVSDAKINYFIDDVPVSPTGYKLFFQKQGKQELKIIIQETPKRIWELNYKLDVRN